MVTVSVGGNGVASTVFLDNANYREWIFRVWQARCTDMESTALAQVAYANRKPALIIRGLSDLAGGQHGKNPIDANELNVAEIAAHADGVVVGSALIDALKNSLDSDNRATSKTVDAVTGLVAEIAKGVRRARPGA